MRNIALSVLTSGMILALGACGGTSEQRAATGGLGGAAAGATMDEPMDEPTSRWDRAGPEGGAAAGADLTRREVSAVQEALNEAGYDIAVDGIWGPNTREALRGFQQAQGLPPTGTPTPQTMAALGSPVR